jgi:hypothetical protein
MADVMSMLSQLLATKGQQAGMAQQGQAASAPDQSGGMLADAGPGGQANNLNILSQLLGGNGGMGGGTPLASKGQNVLNWSGGFDPQAMLASANQVTGKNLNDPNYWQGRYQEEGGSSGAYASPDYWYQKMLGKGAAGADAAPNGPYSAKNGYNYTPTAQELGIGGQAPGGQVALNGLNFNPLLPQGQDYTQMPASPMQAKPGGIGGVAQKLAQPRPPVNSAGIMGKLFGGGG